MGAAAGGGQVGRKVPEAARREGGMGMVISLRNLGIADHLLDKHQDRVVLFFQTVWNFPSVCPI